MTRVNVRALIAAACFALLNACVLHSQSSTSLKDSSGEKTVKVFFGVQALYAHSDEYFSPGNSGGIGAQVKLRVFRFERGGEIFGRFAVGFNPAGGEHMPYFTAIDFTAGIKPIDPVYVVFGIAKLRVNDTGDAYHSDEGGASCTMAGIGLVYLRFFAEFDYYTYLSSVYTDPMHADGVPSRGSYSNTAFGFRVGYYF